MLLSVILSPHSCPDRIECTVCNIHQALNLFLPKNHTQQREVNNLTSNVTKIKIFKLIKKFNCWEKVPSMKSNEIKQNEIEYNEIK